MPAEVVILWVDDEEPQRRAVARALADDHVEVVTAPTGLHALQVLGNRRVDIVISDQKMPGLAGTKLLETVAQRWPDTVRVLVTGHPDLDAFMDAVNLGHVLKILVKPMDMNSLREEVAALINECLARRTSA